MNKKVFQINKTDRITAYVLEHSESSIKISDVAKTLKVSKGIVSLAIKKLNNAKIARNKNIDMRNPLTRSLKVVATITKMTNSGAIDTIKKYSVAAGLYGSSANGTDTSISDIDIWIKPKSDLSQLEISKITRKLSDMLGRRVQIIVISSNRLKKIKNETANFYYSLLFGSIVLFGDGIE